MITLSCKFGKKLIQELTVNQKLDIDSKKTGKITSIDNQEKPDDGKNEMATISIQGQVKYKGAKFMSVDTMNNSDYLSFPTEGVKMALDFSEGDFVVMVAKVKEDPHYVDTNGEILDITEIYPIRTTKQKLSVFETDPHGCLIGNEYVLIYEEVAEEVRGLKIKDVVNFEAIKSHQTFNNRLYKWRVSKVLDIKKTKDMNVEEAMATYQYDNKDRNKQIDGIEKQKIATSSFVQKDRKQMCTQNTNDPDIVPGEKLCRSPRFIDIPMEGWNVPTNLRDLVLNNNSIFENIKDELKWMFDVLGAKNYNDKLHNMIYLEELALKNAFMNYNLDRAHFSRGIGPNEEGFLKLYVKNIHERRPSVTLGDSVRITSPFQNKMEVYEGFVHKVMQDSILLKFNEAFHSNYDGEDYRVEFCFSRLNFRKQHHAVDILTNRWSEKYLLEYLFPKGARAMYPQLDLELNDEYNLQAKGFTRKYEWFNKQLNFQQRKAVFNILRGEFRPIPYVIFGPPGTGKTMTIVETILQIVKNVHKSRLIVGTPSNSSANLITELLVKSGALRTGDFLRLVSFNQIEKELIPEELKKYCGTIDISQENEKGMNSNNEKIKTASGLLLKCKKSYLSRQKIIISTMSTLGSMMQIRFKSDHFTHIILDEAGQCLETDTLIPFTFLNKDGGQVILAGDHMQLGPIVISKIAKKFGYETSFLERILKTFSFYERSTKYEDDGHYNPKFLTKLLFNYRSHPTILESFNDLFYKSELVSKISDTDSNEAKMLIALDDLLPDKNGRETSGLYFFNINGTNVRSPDSPSWFNREEGRRVFNFYCDLLGKKVKSSSVGIITPYSKQVKYIRGLIQETGLEVPKVGTIEEFQGQERDIILISTVRSSSSKIESDLAYGLGFVKSQKRMNVAISRGRALVVIFGNRVTLSEDPNWASLIKLTTKKNTYFGADSFWQSEFAPVHRPRGAGESNGF